jgi:hypothetical protein
MSLQLGVSSMFYRGHAAPAIPDSVGSNLDLWWPIDENSGKAYDVFSDEPISLNGAVWSENTSEYYKDYAIDTDTNSTTTSDNNIGVNNDTCSVCMWASNWTTGRAGLAGIDSGGNYGWWLENAQLLHYGPSFNTAISFSNNFRDNLDVFFIGLVFNGDNADAYVWDTSNHIEDGSGSAPRNLTDVPIQLGWEQGFDNNSDIDISAVGVNESTQLSKTDFENIWNDTKP